MKFPGRAKAELLGAINYIAAAVIVLDEQAVVASKASNKTMQNALAVERAKHGEGS